MNKHLREKIKAEKIIHLLERVKLIVGWFTKNTYQVYLLTKEFLILLVSFHALP